MPTVVTFREVSVDPFGVPPGIPSPGPKKQGRVLASGTLCAPQTPDRVGPRAFLRRLERRTRRIFFGHERPSQALAVGLDDELLWLTTQTSNDVAVIRTSDRKRLERTPVGRDPSWVELTPDGVIAVVSNTGSNDVSPIDVSKRELVATVDVGRSPKRLAVGFVVIRQQAGPNGNGQ